MSTFDCLPNWQKIGWAAGLFEGEGSIDAHCSGKRRVDGTKKRFPRMSLAMSDKDMVYRFWRTVGSGSVGKRYRKDKNHKWMWRWEATCRQARIALKFLSPYFGIRRSEQARKAFGEGYDNSSGC